MPLLALNSLVFAAAGNITNAVNKTGGKGQWAVYFIKLSMDVNHNCVPLFLQVEFHRFLSLFHDDLSNSLRRVDRALVGLYESRSKTGEKQITWLVQTYVIRCVNCIRIDIFLIRCILRTLLKRASPLHCTHLVGMGLKAGSPFIANLLRHATDSCIAND